MKIEQYKHVNLNLALSSLTFFEPGSAPVYKITNKLKVSIWDKWEVTVSKGLNDTLFKLFEYFKTNMDIFPNDLL